ncbi:hypothetical protein L2E82_12234 [Cichorium intybus]|uniref:Uncharacterized protein n=1 Tax=Cichorium intybus TaxID=13427 RepID=A0ACB9GF02_CICIN|nr:hypothetical protein L2E82_12234 [Cichorium intybus]
MGCCLGLPKDKLQRRFTEVCSCECVCAWYVFSGTKKRASEGVTLVVSGGEEKLSVNFFSDDLMVVPGAFRLSVGCGVGCVLEEREIHGRCRGRSWNKDEWSGRR